MLTMQFPHDHVISFLSCRDSLLLHSFPTRRSSDLYHLIYGRRCRGLSDGWVLSRQWFGGDIPQTRQAGFHARRRQDRKSTRLNSSHVAISYAVFCLTKKKKDCSVCLSLQRHT